MSEVSFDTYAPQAEDSFLTAFKRFAKQFDQALNPNPGAWSRKVVIHGSSVAAGAGASSTTSWAGLLTARLEALGNFTVANKAVSGTTSAEAVSTFYSRVVVEDPDIVFLGFSFRNDGMASASTTAARNAIYDAYLANILKLVEMCRQLGYDVIVGGVYPSDEYTAEVLEYLYQFDRDMESHGVPYVPFLRVTNDGTGHWQAAYDYDAAHPNAAGHEAMASAIPNGLFVRDRLLLSRLSFQSNQQLGNGHSFPSDVATATPIKHVFDSAPLTSWTVAVWFKVGAGGNNRVVLSLSDSTRIRIPSNLLNLAVSNGNTISTSTTGTNDAWHHVALTYRDSESEISLWVDGAKVDTVTYDASAITFISLGGNPAAVANNMEGAKWRHYGFWRGELSEAEIIALYRGRIPSSGCEMFCPMNDPEVLEGGRFVNLGTSTGYLLMQQPGGSVPA